MFQSGEVAAAEFVQVPATKFSKMYKCFTLGEDAETVFSTGPWGRV